MGGARRYADRNGAEGARGPESMNAGGKLDDIVTYLEMKERPTRLPVPVPQGKLALMRAERCSVAFYRYLYNTAGENWLWFQRPLSSDERLAALHHNRSVELLVL